MIPLTRPAIRPLLGNVMVLSVIVDGPGLAKLTPAEATDIDRSVQSAVQTLDQLGRAWALAQTPAVKLPILRLSVFKRPVTVTVDRTAIGAITDGFKREEAWLHPVLDKLGAPQAPSPNPSADRIELLRRTFFGKTFQGLTIDDVVPVIIGKYPLRNPGGHAKAGAAMLDWFDVTGSGLFKLRDAVIAHEIAHVFGAADEYAKSNCRTDLKLPPFDAANANCENGNSNPDPCLMTSRYNKALCKSTELHLGWRDKHKTGLLELAAPATLTAVDARAAAPGSSVKIKGTNVYAARSVLFGSKDAGEIEDLSANEIRVEVPASLSGVVEVSVVTSRGTAATSFDGSWFVGCKGSPPSPVVNPGPIVLGVTPRSGPVGTRVKIVGSRMQNLSAVTFGGTLADTANVVVRASGEVAEATVPAGVSGDVEVKVIDSKGTSPTFETLNRFQVQ